MMSIFYELHKQFSDALDFSWKTIDSLSFLNEINTIRKGDLQTSAGNTDETPRVYYCCLIPYKLIRVKN